MVKDLKFLQDGFLPPIETQLSEDETDDDILNIQITGSIYSRKDRTSKAYDDGESVPVS